EPAADDPGETADGPLGDREVRQAVDVQVQHPVDLGVVTVERTDQGERGQIDPGGGESGVAHGGEQPFDHVALSGHENDALARAGGRVDDAQRVEVQDGVV